MEIGTQVFWWGGSTASPVLEGVVVSCGGNRCAIWTPEKQFEFLHPKVLFTSREEATEQRDAFRNLGKTPNT